MKKNNYNIIAFAGRKRSGKTCLCKMLQQEENAVIITIANYLKYLCCELMNMSYEELNEKIMAIHLMLFLTKNGLT